MQNEKRKTKKSRKIGKKCVTPESFVLFLLFSSENIGKTGNQLSAPREGKAVVGRLAALAVVG